MTAQAFWDSSVLVPLCVDQPPHTIVCRALYRRYRVNAWWGTTVEIVSALIRIKRFGAITELEYLDAKIELSRLAVDWSLIGPSDSVKALAATLLEAYTLRAADALQLAAALEWCEGRPQGFVFLTADRRLALAAESAGFSLEPGLI